MKNLLVCSLVLSVLPFSLFAQGPLTPPGAPAPTMRSLDQIEARTPISSVPYFINSSGSYYLTKNLTVSSGSAITINVNDVTLDLNGFTLFSTQNPASSASAITAVSGVRNVAIANGTISSGVTLSGGNYSGSGFGYGIYLANAVTARVSHVSVTGCVNHGIYLGLNSTVVENCTVDTVGGYGIAAGAVLNSTVMNSYNGISGNNVNNCSASKCLLYGINAATVSNCYASTTGFNTPAILAITASNSWGDATDDCGVRASNVDNCYGTTTGSSSGGGVYGVTVNNSRGDSFGSCVGLRADELASNSYGHNFSTGPGLVASNAEHCSGYAAGAANGLDVEVATGCTGISATSGKGINAVVANGCKGQSNSGIGVNAPLVTASYGKSSSYRGIYSDGVVTNSRGASTSGDGIRMPINGIAAYSFGSSSNTGTGIGAQIAIGCSGSSNSSAATLAVPTVIFSAGTNGTGPGIDAITAFNCDTGGNLLSASHRYFCGSGAAIFP